MFNFETMWLFISLLAFISYCTASIKVAPVSSPVVALSFAPISDECTKSIYYVNYIATGNEPSIFRYDYNEDRVFSAYIDGLTNNGNSTVQLPTSPPSFILPISKGCNEFNNRFTVGVSHYTYEIEWDGLSPVAKWINRIFSVENTDPKSRWCLSKPDIYGHFYGGTTFTTFCNSPSNASFYMYSRENGVQRLFGGLISTTGVASKPGTLYHADACTLLVTAYDAGCTGDICNARIVFDFKTLGYRLPDFVILGLEIDTDGMLYTTNYVGDTIWKINPRKSTASVIARMPSKGIGGLTWGGPYRDILYVVTVSTIVDVLHYGITNSSHPSLYKITGLGLKGGKTHRVNL